MLTDMLKSDSAEVRAEAARAIGELEINKCVPELLALLDDVNDDVRMAVVWSLSQIGGEGVREALEALFESTDDEEEADFIASALENLTFSEESGLLGLFEFQDDDEEVGDFDLLNDDEEVDD